MKEGEKLNNRISFDREKSWEKEARNEQVNFRFNIITILVYIIGIILIVQLFNLQVVNGESYREQSNTRLTRESVLEASRGAILDKTGTPLVTSKIQFSLETLYFIWIYPAPISKYDSFVFNVDEHISLNALIV